MRNNGYQDLKNLRRRDALKPPAAAGSEPPDALSPSHVSISKTTPIATQWAGKSTHHNGTPEAKIRISDAIIVR